MNEKNDRAYEMNDTFAFFLGDAYAFCDHTYGSELIAPFTFNKNNDESVMQNLSDYRTLIGFLAELTNFDYEIRDRSKGFDIVFAIPKDRTVEQFFLEVNDAVLAGETSMKEAFLTGVYEGRGSFDANELQLRKIVVDLSQDETLAKERFDFIEKVSASIGYVCEYNKPRKRDNGSLRKAQARLDKLSFVKYVEELGVISPLKVSKIKQFEYFAEHFPKKKNEDNIVSPIIFLEGQPDSPGADKLLAEMVDSVRAVEHQADSEYIEAASEMDQRGPKPIVQDKPKSKSDKKVKIGVGATYPRNTKEGIKAIKIAEHHCENTRCCHELFPRKKDGMPYLEPHHLVPLAACDGFDISLDNVANIVALCSSCHNEIHYGENQQKMICSLYEKRKARLEDAGIFLELERLLEYYGL